MIVHHCIEKYTFVHYPTPIMELSSSEAKAAIGTFFSSVSEDWGKSYWLRVVDNDADMTNNMIDFHEMSLHKLTTLDKAEIDEMLKLCAWTTVKNTRWGERTTVQPNKIRTLLDEHVGIGEYELVQAQPPGSSTQTWYLRLGTRQPGYHPSVNDQVSAGVFKPPRTKQSISRALRLVAKGRDCPVSHLDEPELDEGTSDSGDN